MRDLAVRWLTLAVALFAAGCGAEASSPEAPAPVPPPTLPSSLGEQMHVYATNATVRRQALESSLVVRDNGYAKLRLEHYEKDWSALPEWNPPVAPMRVDGEEPLSNAWTSLDAGGDDWSEETLRALGEKAFFSYPVQLSSGMRDALDAPDHAGVWSKDGSFAAVWAETKGGATPSFTCATCHATNEGGRIVAGKNNADLDGGSIFHTTWGRGRIDVTDDDALNPVAITDLRPVRWQINLHHAATIKNDPVALAIRIETLVITANQRSVRPPRRIAAALAVYLLSLDDGRERTTSGAGADVFAKTCSACHDSAGAAGVAVALDTVGTDPSVGASTERGTGTYRVPSLRHVGDRRRMFASGDIDDLGALLDPRRSVKGHRYGLELGDAERRALLDYLQTL